MTHDVSLSTRDRLLDATVTLMRTKGAAATGTKEILEVAAAPRGSLYFHFPEGKDQLVLEALERAAADTLTLLQQSLADDGELVDQVGAIFEAIEVELIATQYAGGCAVAVTTVESASASPQYQQGVSAAFATWTASLSARLTGRGLTPAAAAQLADGIVAMMEGATVLARARQDPSALRNAALLMRPAIEAALRSAPSGSQNTEREGARIDTPDDPTTAP